MDTGSFKGWLAALVTIGFLGCIFTLFAEEMREASKDVLLVLIGALVGIVKDVYGYYFGSSEGSARKTELLGASPPSGFIHLRLLLPLALVAAGCLCVAGCAGNGAMTRQDGPSQAIKSAQDAAATYLYAVGAALKEAKPVALALYDAGKIGKEQYNGIVPIYNRALASYQLAVKALNDAVAAGQDPSGSSAYLAKLSVFLSDKAAVDNLIVALGGATEVKP